MTQVQVRAPQSKIIFDGQSLLLIPGPLSNGFPTTLMRGRSTLWDNVAIGGAAWDSLLSRAPQRVYKYAAQSANAMIFMLGGTGDYGTESKTGAQAYAVQKSYADAARVAGFERVFTCTTTPSTAFTPTQDAERIAGNALLVANADGAFDAVIDIANVPELTDPSNTTYYSDGVHWTGDGAASAIPISDSAIRPFLNGLY